MQTLQAVLIVVHLLVVIALVGVVLLQRSEGGALGIGGGGGFMTGRGQANALSRATAILGAMFFATSLIMSIIAGWNRAPRSIVEPTPSSTSAPAGKTETPNLLDQLKQMEQQKNGAPAPAPAAPAPEPAPAAPAPTPAPEPQK